MTRDQLLARLRAFEVRLRSASVQAFFAAQDDETRRRFVEIRQELSLRIAQLGNAQLDEIASELDELSDDLEMGIDSLQSRLDRLDNAIAIVNTISSILSIVGRVAAFA